MADKKKTADKPKEGGQKVAKAKSKIVAHTAEAGAFTPVEGAVFASYPEFAAWVREQKRKDVTFYPLRQVGKELTFRTVEVGKVG